MHGYFPFKKKLQGQNLSPISGIILYAQNYFNQCRSYSLSWTSQDYNLVADCLARNARVVNDLLEDVLSVWM